MDGDEGNFFDTSGTQVALRKKSPTPRASPTPKATSARGKPQRISSVSSHGSSAASSMSRGSAPTRGLKQDPRIMTLTSCGSVPNAAFSNPADTALGHVRVKQLEKDLRACLDDKTVTVYRKRAESVAARAARIGREIERAERARSQNETWHRGTRAPTERVPTSARPRAGTGEEAGDELGISDVISVSSSRLSAPPVGVGKTRARSAGDERRATSLRSETRVETRVAEGTGRKRSWLGRRRLVEWGMGVNPRIVYAPDGDCESEDGLGGGLTATMLCRMGRAHRGWDVVRGGERFVVRVVGSFVCGAGDHVVYSVVGCGRAKVHSRRAGAGFVGVSERGGQVCDERAGKLFTVCVGISAGGKDVAAGEVRWRLGGDEEGGRSAAVLLRFGYYFFLREAGGVRLYTTTDTPEHVRLVARRLADGGIDEQVSASLTYVVVRVAAD